MGAGIFEILGKATALEREGKDVLHFEIGQPDFPTPHHIKEAAKQALDDNYTGYVATTGIQELKEAIQEEIYTTRGFLPTLDQILVLPGANSGIYYMLRAAVRDPGKAEIIYPDPGFITFAAVISYMQAKGVPIPVKEENKFRLDPKDIEAKINPQTRAIIINSPMNPTGSMMTKEELSRIAELAEEHDIYILGDEIYSKMIYDQEFFSVSMRDKAKIRSVILDGFSKAYSMTGWRLGYMVGPEALIERSSLLIASTVSCVSSFSQKAGVAALKGSQDDLNQMMKIFRQRRDRIVSGLNQIPGFSCQTPEGAFYVFPNIQQTGMTSKQLANHLLTETGIACIPGSLFGPTGEGYLRFSYATSMKVIEKAIERMKEIFS